MNRYALEMRARERHRDILRASPSRLPFTVTRSLLRTYLSRSLSRRDDCQPVAARIRDPLYVTHDPRANAHPRRSGKVLGERGKLQRLSQHAAPASVESHDARRSHEGAEHEHDAAVLSEMSDGLDAAPGLIEKGHAARSTHYEFVTIALWRAVQTPFRGQWRGGHEKHGLAGQPTGQLLGDFVVGFSHATIMTTSSIPPPHPAPTF
jgi:hypothetical protein